MSAARSNPVSVYSGHRVRQATFDIHSFGVYFAAFNDVHLRAIRQIADAVAASIDFGRPMVLIKVTGHAARIDKTPKHPPYDVGMFRAEQTVDLLRTALGAQGLAHRVLFADPVSAADHDQIEGSIPRNRRVIVTLSEIDPDRSPWRWVCRLVARFDGAVHRPLTKVHSPFDLTETVGGDSPLALVGTGLLISDRHILTAAHTVAALSQRGPSLTWLRPGRVDVIPGIRGNVARGIQRPHGTWTVRPQDIQYFPGFVRPLSLADYGRGSGDSLVPKLAITTSMVKRDLAVLTLRPRRVGRRRELGQRRVRGGIMGWWNKSAQDRLGFSRSDRWMVDDLLRAGPDSEDWPVTSLGYHDTVPSLTHAHLFQNDGLAMSRDLVNTDGDSGAPWWTEDIDGGRRLVGVCHGFVNPDVFGANVNAQQPLTDNVPAAVLLSRDKVRWIRRAMRRRRFSG